MSQIQRHGGRGVKPAEQTAGRPSSRSMRAPGFSISLGWPSGRSFNQVRWELSPDGCQLL
jgi:hypothetical protein